MRICMSYWSSDFQRESIKTPISFSRIESKKYLIQKSLYFIKKYYKSVHFVTDEIGFRYFKDLGWDSISIGLEELPKEYYSVWSLGKIKSYNILSKIGDPFLHIDSDVFLFKKLSKWVENEDIVLEFEEKNTEAYCLNYFNEACKEKFLNGAYNCGIVGGKNLNFFLNYSNFALDLVLNKNKNFWLNDWENHQKNNKNFKNFTKATIAEQASIYSYVHKNNFKHKCYVETEAVDLLENKMYSPYHEEFFNRLKYIHLISTAKNHLLENYTKRLLLNNNFKDLKYNYIYSPNTPKWLEKVLSSI